jgi:CHAT domain-containing protein
MIDSAAAGSVFEEFLQAHPEATEFVVVNLGPSTLSYPPFVEPTILVPLSYLQGVGVDSSVSRELMMAGAWDALEPMHRHGGVGPALGAQILAAVGGNPLRAAADPQRHIRLVLDALDGFRGRGLPRHEGRGYLELGRALRNFGRFRDALTAFERGRVLLEQTVDDHGLRAAHTWLAELLGRGDVQFHELALLHAEEGLRIGARLSRPGADGPPDPGDAHFTASLHMQRVYTLTEIGLTTDAETALDAWQRESGDHYPVELLRTTGDLRFRQHRFADAVNSYIRAIDAKHGDLHGGSMADRSYRLEKSIDLFAKAAGAALSIDRPDLALAVLCTATTSRSVRPPGPPPEALQVLDTDATTLARRATAATVARDKALLSDCNDRARIFLETREIMLSEGEHRASRNRATVAGLARDLVDAVQPGELALWYGQDTDGGFHGFVIHDGAAHHLELDLRADEVQRLADRAREECLRRTGTESLHLLGRMILDPIADLLARTSRFYVTAQDPLEDFPFHAAPFQGKPLVASVEVRALPSLVLLRSFGDRRQPLTGGGRRKAVVVAVPQPRYELLPALPALRAEVAAVNTAFPDTIGLYDDDATAEAVRTALSTADVLHFAGHTAFEPRQPTLARILLADRPLFAFEIACASQVPRLVNLSGCRAGAQRRTLGGEGEGLPAAFLAAGAQAVIAPLWPVRDDAALAFNEALYRELAEPGADVTQAARRAQLALMADPRFDHPGLWGPFTLHTSH